MRSRHFRLDAVGLKAAGAVAVLLIVLAVLQYHWLSQISRAEQERMQAYVRSAAERFAHDFNREITRAFLAFHWQPSWQQRDPEDVLGERMTSWQAHAPYPKLVAEVIVLEVSEGSRRARRLDPETGLLTETPWPGLVIDRGGEALGFARGNAPVRIDSRLPALVMPLGPPDYRAEVGDRAGRRALVLRFDRAILTQEILPELAHRHLELGGAQDFDALVVDLNVGKDPVVFSTHDGRLGGTSALGFEEPDATARLLILLPFPEMRRLGVELGMDRRRARPPARRERRMRRELPRDPPALVEPESPAGTGWRLEVRHRAGSLEAAVARARNRNLALGMGVLGLLGVTLGMLVVASRRSEQLARQQMEFVAGVTHELQTPLAVIRSAAQNLSDGVVEERDQVRKYGRVLEREGRRLSDMVEDVLDFAGIQSRQKQRVEKPVRINEIVDPALRELEPILAEAEVTLEKRIPDDLPAVKGDPEALRRALRNLVVNAAKHARAGHWIGIDAQENRDGPRREVCITVRDRGPGIDPRDLPYLFEPFYRGRQAEPTRGSGLGLSLVRRIVEAHDGRVIAENAAEGGAWFHIVLPTYGELAR